MDKELEELKSALRAMVVSSPTAVDARSLARDYRELVGTPLPLRRYGHHSFADFLRNHCQDCFKLQGTADNPVLILIVPDNLKHIDRFVRSQKIAATAKHKGKRFSVPGNITTSCNLMRPKRNNIVTTQLENKKDPNFGQLDKQEVPPLQDSLNINTKSREDSTSTEQESTTINQNSTDKSDAGTESDEGMHFLESVAAAPLPALGARLELRLGESFRDRDWVVPVARLPALAARTQGLAALGGRAALAADARRVGQYAAARCAGRWWRALLLATSPDRALVRLVDCGALLAAGWDDVRPLPRRWASEPAAAFCARLRLPAGVRRCDLRARPFTARVTARDEQEELVVLAVADSGVSGRVARLQARLCDPPEPRPPETPLTRRLSLLRAVAVD